MFSLRNKENYLLIILNTPLIWSSGEGILISNVVSYNKFKPV